MEARWNCVWNYIMKSCFRFSSVLSRPITTLLLAAIGLVIWSGGHADGQRPGEVSESALNEAGLVDYALYQRAQSLLSSERAEEAERFFRQLTRRYPTSLLSRSATLEAAGSSYRRGRYQQTLDDLGALIKNNDGSALKLTVEALLKLNRRDEALRRLKQLYFDAPQSAEADAIDGLLKDLGLSQVSGDAADWRRRADNLYEARLWILAANAYRKVERDFADQSSDQVRLRAGISYYKGNSFNEAVQELQRVRSRVPSISSEASYYLAMAQLSLENEDAALATLGALRRLSPESSLVADLLYSFGRFYEKRERFDLTEQRFSEIVTRFQRSDKADEAHFWLGWHAHLAGDYSRAARILTEHLARYGERTENRGRAGFWAAVDHERSGNRARALTLYRGLLRRYGAGWYGVNAEKRIARLAAQKIEGQLLDSDLSLRQAVLGLQGIRSATESLREADLEKVARAGQLTRLGLYQSAMNELEAVRTGHPDSPLVNLRIAQILRNNGDPVGAINALKRAYPDYAQAHPEEMRREEWEIFYPLKWWSEIRQESQRHAIDPYLIAGIIRQETVFNPRARSRANALGLMQLLPSTGTAVAKKNSIGGGRISNADLFNPTINIRLGTAYVKELLDRFDKFEYVAAAYNGGPTRVSRWLKELPAVEIEEWIENIPISETRLYVQGVYRNSRQYQRLYDESGRFRQTIPR